MIRRLLAASAAAVFFLAAAVAHAADVPAGPPFPEPEIDRAVYDHAGIFRADTIEVAEATIDAIENRTGAEVVVYTQVVHYGITESEAEAHARALMDQWGVGRKGFDDGLVILFDLDPTLEHGQVQLYAGPGYRATFLSNDERQAIFEDDMLPRLREADMDSALRIALAKIDANATPEHAARLQAARQLDAVTGLVGAPIVFLLLAGWALASWWRFGRDPVYLDSPSVHLPAPPPDLTAAGGAVVLEGGATRRALTTTMLDLASRGLVSFREEQGLLGLDRKVGIETAVPQRDPVTEAHRIRNARRPIGKAEAYALERLRLIARDQPGGYIEPDRVLSFGQDVATFDERLEGHVVRQGWFSERPAAVRKRWRTRAGISGTAGAVALFAGLQLPSNGVLLLGVAAIGGAIVMAVVARAMPAVTMPGAMIRAMLFAYRRTLEKTMARARSMQQVVDEARLDWLDTPDQAVVWGVALGLEGKVE
ncbi:MAG TPA: TPM domain-containing protein, partial [Vitreimonas sp.]|nr:TPM domain-containing protein [Vitreimonas sp.]